MKPPFLCQINYELKFRTFNLAYPADHYTPLCVGLIPVFLGGSERATGSHVSLKRQEQTQLSKSQSLSLLCLDINMSEIPGGRQADAERNERK
jgi:hypothetical protein